ncbi:hypothetical protein JOM56_008236 [Amanita muscaria]
MPPTLVKRDSLATTSRHSPLKAPAIPLSNSRPSTPALVSDTHFKLEYNTLAQVSSVFEERLSPLERVQAFYDVFNTLAMQLESTSEFPSVMSRISDNLFHRGFNKPCTLSHAKPCALSHDPVTVTVTKEVHPSSCTTEMKNLRKEISDLKSGINLLYRSANLTHTADQFATPPSLSGFDSSSESIQGSNDSSYESVFNNTETIPSVSSTPKVGPKPFPAVSSRKSYANATKTSPNPPLPNVKQNISPKEIIRNKEAKSCTNKGTPSNVHVLSDFNSANKAGSYERIAEMRKEVNNILADNKCKSISWSARGNLVIKCTKSLSVRDKTDIINSAKTTFENNPIVLNKATISYVKFIDVPLYDTEGTPFDNNDFNVMIQQNEKWTDVNITHGPHIIIKKDTYNAKKATIKVGFTDDKNSATAKRLLKTAILFGGTPIRCKPWTSAPPVRKQQQRAPDAFVSVTEASLAA